MCTFLYSNLLTPLLQEVCLHSIHCCTADPFNKQRPRYGDARGAKPTAFLFVTPLHALYKNCYRLRFSGHDFHQRAKHVACAQCVLEKLVCVKYTRTIFKAMNMGLLQLP